MTLSIQFIILMSLHFTIFRYKFVYFISFSDEHVFCNFIDDNKRSNNVTVTCVKCFVYFSHLINDFFLSHVGINRIQKKGIGDRYESNG